MSIAIAEPAAPAASSRCAWRILGNERLLYGLAGVSCSSSSGSSAAGPASSTECFFGRPTGIIEAGILEVQTPRFWGDLWASFSEFGIGYVLAIIVGIPLGLPPDGSAACNTPSTRG